VKVRELRWDINWNLTSRLLLEKISL
jgi:hypothetical protein